MFLMITSLLINAQTKGSFIFKFKNKTPFYYTENHIQYGNVDYILSDTDLFIYNISTKYARAIRLDDLETMIIPKEYLNIDESIIQDINRFNLNKENALNLINGNKDVELENKINDKKNLDLEYKKLGIAFILSNFTNKKIKKYEELLKDAENVNNYSLEELIKELNDTSDFKNLGLVIRNSYEKDIKYIRFNLTPYNRVDDAISTPLIGSKKIEIIGPFRSNIQDHFVFNNVWLDEENIIDYVKITDIKVTFMDNQMITIKNSNNQFISKTNRIDFK